VGFKQYKSLNSSKIIHFSGFLLCLIAFLTLVIQQFESNTSGVLISLGIIEISFVIEFLYQTTKKAKKLSS